MESHRRTFRSFLAMRIPQEIIDHCIDELFDSRHEADSFKALLSCSQVTRAMNHRCRYHLFSSVSTSPSRQHVYPAPRPRISVLEEILDSNPSLGAYIQELHVDLGFSGSTIPQLEAHLPRVLNLIFQSGSSLKSLELSSRFMNSSNFYEIPHNVQYALVDVLQWSTFTTLKLGFISKVPLSFVLFPNIKHLHLRHVTFVHTSDPDDPDDHVKLKNSISLVKLHTFHIDRFIINFASLVSSATSSKVYLESLGPLFSDLKSLAVRVAGKLDEAGFRIIMQAAANSLVSLEVTTTSDRVALPVYYERGLDIGESPQLQDVIMRLQIHKESRYKAGEESSLLKPPSQPCALSRLKIILDWDFEELGEAELQDAQGWKSLNEFLQSPNLSSLREVEIVVQLIMPIDRFDVRVAQNMAEESLASSVPDSMGSGRFTVLKRVFIASPA